MINNPLAPGDDQLMRQIANGDSKAFRTLFDRHARAVLEFATRTVGGDKTKGEDISQLAWEKVVKAARRYQPQRQFRAWLFTIVRNTAMDELRTVQKFAEEELNETFDSSGSIDRAEIDEQIAKNMKVEELRRAIDDLPETQRLAILAWMSDDGLTQDELAGQLGLTVKAFESLIFRAKRNLSKYLIGKKDEALE